MKRYAQLSFAALVLWAGAAEAQPYTTPAIPPNLSVSVGDTKLSNDDGGFIGRTQCKEDVVFKFQAQYARIVPSLEAWVTETPEQDCSLVANRQLVSAGGSTLCRFAGSQGNLGNGVLSNLTVDATKLFNKDGKACPEASNRPFWVYLVPLPSLSDTNTTAANPPLETATGILAARFILYTKVPDAPTGVKGVDGEQTLGLNWKDDASGDATLSYRVYYDTAQGGGGSDTDAGSDAGSSAAKCGSGNLVAGKEAPATTETILSDTATTSGFSLGASVVDLNQSVAMGVVTVDAAGNESVLSEVVCVKRVPTDGFYERYKRDGGDGLETCSAHAPGRAAWGGWSSLTVIALGLLWRRRRIA